MYCGYLRLPKTDLNEVFNVNVFGVHNVTRAFLPLLKKGSLKKIMNMYLALPSLTSISP